MKTLVNNCIQSPVKLDDRSEFLPLFVDVYIKQIYKVN